MDISASNPLITQADAMNAICKPLFCGSAIGFFAYTRYYSDNTIMKLSTYPEWTTAIIQNNCAHDRNKITHIMQTNKVDFFRDTFYYLLQENNRAANMLGKEYNIDSTLGIIDEQNDYLESFAFASNKMENLLRFYFNNWALLVQFKHYFLDKAKPLITIAEKSLYKLDYDTANQYIIGNISMHSTDIKELQQRLTPEHYYILHQGKRVSITKREFDCLKGMSQGRSNKEIGRLLTISPRTVDSYQSRLKQKLAVHNKSTLIDIYLNSELKIL